MLELRRLFNFLNLLVSLSVIITLIWWHGFQYQPHHLYPHKLYLYLCFGFFVIQFVFRSRLSGGIVKYARSNRFEYLILLVVLAEVLLTLLLDISMLQLFVSLTGIENHDHLYTLTLHILLLFVVGVELGNATSRSTIWKLSPPLLLILSFIVLIAIGSSLLMLPEMTADRKGMSYTDALFTSISANCVTGLTVVDTATYFSLKGKATILMLIQLGGLNIIGFATYFISNLNRHAMSLRHNYGVKEILSTDSLNENKSILKEVFFTSLLIEFIGIIFLYHSWGPGLFENDNDKLFNSLFHSVSAFNNAGFTLFTDGFSGAQVNSLYAVHLVIALLIILGGIGFTTLQEVFQLSRIKNLFRRKSHTLKLQSKIALLSAGVLIVLGMLLFFVVEYDNAMIAHSPVGRVITAFFQSVTSRTAGFSTVDFSDVSISILMVTIVLMFIGASSGSTGGGIKTSTLFVLLSALFRKKNNDRIKHKNISYLAKPLVKKAVAILLYSLLVIITGAVILYFTDPQFAFSNLLFEEVSAFGTVGLSTGITSDLSLSGKIIIMISMFIGRIGPLAIAYTLVKSTVIIDNKEMNGLMIG